MPRSEATKERIIQAADKYVAACNYQTTSFRTKTRLESQAWDELNAAVHYSDPTPEAKFCPQCGAPLAPNQTHLH